jgi:hypothetical protein
MSPKQHAFGNGVEFNSEAARLPMPPAFGDLGLANHGVESPSSNNAIRSGTNAEGHAELSRTDHVEPTLQSHAQTEDDNQDAAIDPSLEGLPPVPSHWGAPASSTKDTARILDFNNESKAANSEIMVDPNLMDVGTTSAEAVDDAMSPTTLLTAIEASRAGNLPDGYSHGERLALSLGAAFEQQEGVVQKAIGNGFEGVNGDLGVDEESRTQVDSQGSNGESSEIDLVAW